MLRRAARKTALFVVAVFAVGCLWETYKLIGPVDGGTVFGWKIIPKASDRAMPHTWDMVARLLEPENRSGGSPIAITVAGYSWYTLRLAAAGLAIGGVVGIGLAVLMARWRIASRAILPWVIMSQTVPLIALAPQVVSWSGKIDLFGWEWPRWASVCALAAFLSFFPVAVGTLKGLTSVPAASLELMETYAVPWRVTLVKLRFPAAVPFIIPSLKLAATLSVVGVIVSEISTGIRGGIGRAVISYQQASTGDAEKIYAAVFGAAALGLALFGSVVLLDVIVNRNRPREATS